jgi:ribosome recycling factor
MVFEATLDHLSGELARMRTGRAHPSMFEEVIVEAYGTKMPLNQVANITVPEAQLLQITPFDPNNLQAISNAIRNNQSLGLNPSDDGRVVRVQIPPLTEERRKELAKQIGEKLEEAQIRMRNARHEAFKELDAAKKDKQISEDDVKRTEKAIEDNMTLFRNRMEQAAKAKEKEILTL